MTRALARAAAVVAAAIAVTVLTVPDSDATPGHLWEACANDEAIGGPCVWDARHNGNGRGHSFIVRADGHVTYVTHARAHRMTGAS